MEYLISDFSKISRLSVKTLRYYHEINLIVPARIDQHSGYRYYNDKNLEQVIVLQKLRTLGFSIQDIIKIFGDSVSDTDLIEPMVKKLNEIREVISSYQHMETQVQAFLAMQSTDYNFERCQPGKIEVPGVLVASRRFTGHYSQINQHLQELYQTAADRISGARPFALYYDDQSMEAGADIEVCLPIFQNVDNGRTNSRFIPGGSAISGLHWGPYETISLAYQQVLNYILNHGIQTRLPVREVYLKGAGDIFKGNPQDYITEIQFLII